MQAKTKLTHQHVEDFVARHHLPDKFFKLIDDHYSPLAEYLVNRRPQGGSFFLGINGAQGTGKSTLAEYLQLELALRFDLRVAVLSIDDFYLTRTERELLAKKIHPLLATRGVPGTHDVQMLEECIDRLRALRSDSSMTLPRFDKAQDDRAEIADWPIVSGPIDVIILEGWCVGSLPQPSESLSQSINSLEKLEDTSGDWRRFVNEQLKEFYDDVFAQMDELVLLQAPNFDAIFRWRVEQEEKLSAAAGHDAAGIMSDGQIAKFLQHYERLTRANLADLPAVADVVLELDDDHDCVRSHYAMSQSGQA